MSLDSFKYPDQPKKGKEVKNLTSAIPKQNLMKGRDRGNFLALSQLIKTYKHVISSDVIAHSVKQIEQKKWNEMVY